MGYFSNRPGPTPGHQLPRPNCSAEVLREKEKVGVKRKIEGLDTSNEHMLAHVFFLCIIKIHLLYLIYITPYCYEMRFETL